MLDKYEESSSKSVKSKTTSFNSIDRMFDGYRGAEISMSKKTDSFSNDMYDG